MCILKKKKKSKEEENILAFPTVLYKNIDLNKPTCRKRTIKTPPEIDKAWNNLIYSRRPSGNKYQSSLCRRPFLQDKRTLSVLVTLDDQKVWFMIQKVEFPKGKAATCSPSPGCLEEDLSFPSLQKYRRAGKKRQENLKLSLALSMVLNHR